MRTVVLLVFLCLLPAACSAPPPRKADNICDIFSEKRGWYRQAARAERRWGTPIPILIAFTHQESSFRARARPPRKKLLGFIPGRRPTSAYGYVQAINSTWDSYRKATHRAGAERNNFGDAVDFVGWYNDQSHRRVGLAKTDAYNLYLAYHEGQGGFQRRTYEGKTWLTEAAARVASRSRSYTAQLQQCEQRFKRRRFLFF